MAKVTNNSDNGKCSNCGECCSNLIPMSEAEIQRIKRYMAKHPIKEQFYRSLLDVKNTDMTCPFRDWQNKKCLIYEVRPEICRRFLCSNGTEYSVQVRDVIAKQNRHPVFARAEFFGNTEDVEFFASWQERMALSQA